MTLESVFDFIRNIFFIRFDDAGDVFKAVVEILLFSYLIYRVIDLVKETRAWQLLKGIMFLLTVTVLSNVLQFSTLTFVLNNTFSVMAIGALIIFQPELRRGLEQIGRSTLKDIFGGDIENTQIDATIKAIVRAAAELAKTRTGALIVIEKETKVGDIINTGIIINADVTAELLINIFAPNTPLHDGAVVVRDNKVIAATCYLPLTENNEISKELGTRHRAAIGVTEVSDALGVVISEETGSISVAQNGELKRGITADALRRLLKEKLYVVEAAVKKITFLRGKGKNG